MLMLLREVERGLNPTICAEGILFVVVVTICLSGILLFSSTQGLWGHRVRQVARTLDVGVDEALGFRKTATVHLKLDPGCECFERETFARGMDANGL